MKFKLNFTALLFFFIILSGWKSLLAIETAPRISDREIIESLAEIKTGQKTLMVHIEALKELTEERFKQVDERFEQVDKRFEQVDKRFEQVDKRFELVDKRFEQVDKRFEQMDKRFEQVNNRFGETIDLITTLFGSLIVLIIAVLGYSIWDRRTMTKKVSERVKKIEADLDVENIDGSKLFRLIEVLKNLSKKDRRLKEVLHSFNLL